MKRKHIIGMVCLLTAAFLFSSCIIVPGDFEYDDDDYDYEYDELVGSSWARAGELLSFDTEYSGSDTIFDKDNPSEAVQHAFTYIFDTSDGTGIITFKDSYDDYDDDTILFKIKTNNLEETQLELETEDGDFTFTEVAYRSAL
ncbi:MAG: hypothetical protein LBV20_05705 [Treponema sp.]|nr:hypothetical protein [Treponema sp.]